MRAGLTRQRMRAKGCLTLLPQGTQYWVDFSVHFAVHGRAPLPSGEWPSLQDSWPSLKEALDRPTAAAACTAPSATCLTTSSARQVPLSTRSQPDLCAAPTSMQPRCAARALAALLRHTFDVDSWVVLDMQQAHRRGPSSRLTRLGGCTQYHRPESPASLQEVDGSRDLEEDDQGQVPPMHAPASRACRINYCRQSQFSGWEKRAPYVNVHAFAHDTD